ncbi:hypothetical protein CN553_28030 [Bacillus cereus]|uniref:Transposase n=1 Tax=Bacillus cereus TaxID=1396 RepID=A0A9X6U6K7_BACCE|nr:transposase [Bacillus cereus]PEN83255.1 hypothetical protein CN553_28030 [Bacillus cereus]
MRIRIDDYRRQLKQQTVEYQNTYISRYRFRMIQKNPALKELYNFYHSFLNFFTAKQTQDLKKLIGNGISGSLKPIQEYCKRLYQDIDAIINDCVYPFSNGLLEEQVNRLKTIKRMYERYQTIYFYVQGFSIKEIMKTIYNYVNAYKEKELNDLPMGQSMDKPRKLSSEQELVQDIASHLPVDVGFPAKHSWTCFKD